MQAGPSLSVTGRQGWGSDHHGRFDRQIPKNSISKVTLEEKVLESWYNGRAVLLGDGEDFFLFHVFVLPDGKTGAFADLYNSRLQIRTNSMSQGTL